MIMRTFSYEPERHGTPNKNSNWTKTVRIFDVGKSFSTVMNVKIEKRLTIVRSRREAVIYSKANTIDEMTFEEKEQLLKGTLWLAERCKRGRLIFSEHRGSLRSLKRFHCHLIFEDQDDFNQFIPTTNHDKIVKNDPAKRLDELKNWAENDYVHAEQRLFQAVLKADVDKVIDDTKFDSDIEKGCSKIHIPIVPNENPLDTVYRYIRKYGLVNYHLGIVFSPGGYLEDIFIHVFPPEFIEHVILHRNFSLMYANQYLENFKQGIETNNINCFLTT
jgi:hypothetical protein